MMKVGIIGGGASGMMSAILLDREGIDVTIIEKNSTLGKKILMTGNGRCNYFNAEINSDKYYTSDYEFLKNIIKQENIAKAQEFLTSIGLVPRIKNGYYYPSSNTATSVLNAFLTEIEKRKIKVILDSEVNNIKRVDDKYQVTINTKKMTFDKIIIAIGSKAGLKENENYALLESLNIKMTPVLPALCPLILNGNFFNKWSGIRVEASVSIYEDNKFIKDDLGEVQLTDYGISGICVMNLSSLVSKALYNKKKVSVHLNFLPNLKKEEIDAFLTNRDNTLYQRTVIELLESIIPYKLLYILVSKSGINSNCHYKSLTKKEKDDLISNLSDLTLDVIATKEIFKGQVVTGGIPLNRVKTTLEDKEYAGLYYTGEILDVDGICGGFNLGFAWLSSIVVGDDNVKSKRN